MEKVDIAGHSTSAMRRAGRDDGRLWRWTARPWFVVAKAPLPKDQEELSPRILEVKRAAEEMVAGVLRDWHVADGHQQKLALKAIAELRKYSQDDPDSVASYVARSSAAFEQARVDRKTAWKIAGSSVAAIAKRYAELGQAYVHANQAARQDPDFEIRVPALDVPAELLSGGLTSFSDALHLTERDCHDLHIRSDGDSTDKSDADAIAFQREATD